MAYGIFELDGGGLPTGSNQNTGYGGILDASGNLYGNTSGQIGGILDTNGNAWTAAGIWDGSTGVYGYGVMDTSSTYHGDGVFDGSSYSSVSDYYYYAYNSGYSDGYGYGYTDGTTYGWNSFMWNVENNYLGLIVKGASLDPSNSMLPGSFVGQVESDGTTHGSGILDNTYQWYDSGILIPSVYSHYDSGTYTTTDGYHETGIVYYDGVSAYNYAAEGTYSAIDGYHLYGIIWDYQGAPSYSATGIMSSDGTYYGFGIVGNDGGVGSYGCLDGSGNHAGAFGMVDYQGVYYPTGIMYIDGSYNQVHSDTGIMDSNQNAYGNGILNGGVYDDNAISWNGSTLFSGIVYQDSGYSRYMAGSGILYYDGVVNTCSPTGVFDGTNYYSTGIIGNVDSVPTAQSSGVVADDGIMHGKGLIYYANPGYSWQEAGIVDIDMNYNGIGVYNGTTVYASGVLDGAGYYYAYGVLDSSGNYNAAGILDSSGNYAATGIWDGGLYVETSGVLSYGTAYEGYGMVGIPGHAVTGVLAEDGSIYDLTYAVTDAGGTLVVPGTGQVQLGVQYGIGGTDRTGELVAGGVGIYPFVT